MSNENKGPWLVGGYGLGMKSYSTQLCGGLWIINHKIRIMSLNKQYIGMSSVSFFVAQLFFADILMCTEQKSHCSFNFGIWFRGSEVKFHQFLDRKDLVQKSYENACWSFQDWTIFGVWFCPPVFLVLPVLVSWFARNPRSPKHVFSVILVVTGILGGVFNLNWTNHLIVHSGN